MAVSSINYNNKVDLNTTSVADINKVSASDLNQIKNVVNTNATELNNLVGTKLWTNSNPSATFSSQTITLSESLANYNCYEILYRQNIRNVRTMTSGKIPVGSGTILSMVSGNEYRATGTTVSGNTISFESASSSNENIIPLYVIGYKLGVF